ncbi:MAG: hypothetical protein FWD68_10865 [Alphaproteobacteria bacterium]|nr:hypothetical protein [Alphaproteobacteria bacterium]
MKTLILILWLWIAFWLISVLAAGGFRLWLAQARSGILHQVVWVVCLLGFLVSLGMFAQSLSDLKGGDTGPKSASSASSAPSPSSSSSLVWIQIFDGTPIGSFKTREGCIAAHKQVVSVSKDDVKLASEQGRFTVLCYPVETPLTH